MSGGTERKVINMMREEFEELLPADKVKDLTDQEYKQIEYVYTYHPLDLSKQDTAFLYAKFGFGIFNDLLENAQKAATYEQNEDDARLQLERACTQHDMFVQKYRGNYKEKRENA